MSDRLAAPEARSFLAAPDAASDWRMLLVYDAAAGTGVLDALPGTAEEVAARRGLDARAVRIVLDVLAEWRIVDRADAGYTAGAGMPDGEQAAILRHHARSIHLWAGALNDRLHGTPPAPREPPSPELRDLWYAALAAFARPAAPAVVDACLERFPAAERVLDLGGGHGAHAQAFAARGLSATLQDRPEAIERARSRGLEAAGVDLFGGDFFQTLPEGPFDLVFCAAVTDTYDGERNAALYRHVHTVLAPEGGVALLAFVRGRHPAVAAFAVQMLAVDRGGDTHRTEDYRGWLEGAGFRDIDVVDLDDWPQSLVFASRDGPARPA